MVALRERAQRPPEPDQPPRGTLEVALPEVEKSVRGLRITAA